MKRYHFNGRISGFLLIKQYGGESQEERDSDGSERVAEGKEMLAQLSNKDMPTRLIDKDGAEFTRKTVQLAGGVVATGNVDGANTFGVEDKY